MGDEQVGQPVVAAEIQHQAQELGPDRYVKHRDGLIGYDQLGVHHECPRDDDPLALAAGQLVRVAEGELAGRAQPGALEGGRDPGLLLGSRLDQVVDLERLGHEVVDRLLRVERLVWVLEDDLDPPAVLAELRHAPPVADVLAIEDDLAAGLPGELDDHPAGRRLARARLPHQGQDLALGDRQVDPVHGPDVAARPAQERVEDPAPNREMDLQAGQPQELAHWISSIEWSSVSP